MKLCTPCTLLLRGAFASSLLLATLPTSAQTFFGSGGVTNTATATENVAFGYGVLSSKKGFNTAIGGNALHTNTTGAQNTANGYVSLYKNTTGIQNTADGYAVLYTNSTGSQNSAIGAYALYANTTGAYNTAQGTLTFRKNTIGSANTANGYQALYNNTTSNNSTANGHQSLFANTTGNHNTANGYHSLYYTSTGVYNTGTGYDALSYNVTGSYNTAHGSLCLHHNTTGDGNTANGFYALHTNTTGSQNTASGNAVLYWNTEGNYNTAAGFYTLFFNDKGSQNTASGYKALYNVTAQNNTAFGTRAGQNITTGSNNITIGNPGAAADNGTIRIGTAGAQTSTLIAGINGVTSSAGVAVYINANGQLGTITSSRRFKSDIKTMGTVSEKLLQLRPVTFRYKSTDENGRHPLQYGLIAEEVAKVFPDLVQYDKQGRPFTVYYHLLTPMLLNELQKEHAKSEERNTNIATLTAVDKVQASGIATLRASLQSHATDLASMKQMQAEQQKLLIRLATYIQTSKTKAPIEPVHFVQH